MFDKVVYYAFIIGLILGRMTNFLGVLILSSLVLFFVDPQYYNYENILYLKNLTNSLINGIQFKLPV